MVDCTAVIAAILYIFAFSASARGGGEYAFSTVYNLFLVVTATLFSIIARLTWRVLA